MNILNGFFKDVARLANVSLMTVSRAINSPELLKPETLKQVQQAIESLNYVPDFQRERSEGKALGFRQLVFWPSIQQLPLFCRNHSFNRTNREAIRLE